MKSALQVDCDCMSFEELIGSKHKLEVPPFQRPYSWKKDQWAQLWEDLISHLDQDYLMGGIVLCGADNKRDLIIDGQQRITTISLLIAACRDILWKECEAHNIALGIHSEFIVSGGVVDEKKEPYVILGESDRHWFNSKIQIGPDSKAEFDPPDLTKIPYKLPGSNRLLWKAYQFFTRELKNWLGNKPNDTKVIDVRRIVRQLATQTLFVVTRVPDDTQAYTLFEALNDRGLELSIADLFKNVILGRASDLDRLSKAKDYWSSIVDSLDYENISPFLRYFWMSHNGEKITEEKLFPELKAEVRKHSASELMAYLKSLDAEAENFSEIIGRVETSEDIKQELNLISSYGFRIGNTVLLATWTATTDEEKRLLVFKEVKSFLVKYAIFANQTTNDLEGIMAAIALLFRKDFSKGLAEMRTQFAKKLPPSKSIKDGFLTLEPSISVGRALLLEIEIHLAGTEKIPSSPEKVNVEHIFPQSADGDWVEAFGATGAEDTYLGRLGNLTLLDAKLNKQASNKSYKDKRKTHYSKSIFKITNELKAAPSWTAQDVEARQKDLYESARKIWAIE